MTEEREPIETPASRAPGNGSATRVRTLLVCDLADSTALVERLGDAAASELMRKHDRIARDLVHKHNGREIDKTDGFLVLFERPVEAVAFALAYQRALRSLGEESKQTLRARVGVHVGEVVLWENNAADIAGGAKSLDVEGLAKPVVARLMALAMPGQIVLSGIAFSLAQRAERELDQPANVRWLTHGRYRFKGVAAPMLVHEVGEPGIAPLHAPPSGAKAQKEVPLWRKPGVIALEAIAVLIAIAVPVMLSLRAPPAIAFGERDWIVMGELRNLTGESVLDESLSTAFRISLEQSRYVNVLPDLKLRDALARMQRPPDTAIDRAVASEIAIREGARAVILPTVAEIGGRVRVSAEVIDPHTQTTVYAESADGVGAVSALDSIDAVTHELRAKLGEALAAIENDSAPLPQVTSGNLDALRAYALGYKAYLHKGDYPEAIRLYRQALSLDPDFSQAKVGLARVHLASENPGEAKQLIAQALAHRERLPARERLYAEAFEGGLAFRAEHLDAWKALMAVYPDFFPSYYNYALYAYERENAYTEGITAAAPAINSKNPGLGPLHYLLGMLELGRGEYGPATRQLEQARALGGDSGRWVWAQLYGAQRDYVRAAEAIDNFKPSGLPANDLFAQLTVAAIKVDRGDLSGAVAGLQARLGEAEAAGSQSLRVLSGAALALNELLVEPEEFETQLRGFVDGESRYASSQEPAERPHAAFALAWAAGAASRSGWPELAGRAAESSAAAMHGLRYPVVEQMLLAARAQVAAVSDGPAVAQELLRGLSPERAPLAARELQADLLAMSGDVDGAIRVLEWLANARGRAYVEAASNHMLKPRNVIGTTLALLRLAELQTSAGNPKEARKRLDAFDLAWRGTLPPRLSERRSAVLRALNAN